MPWPWRVLRFYKKGVIFLDVLIEIDNLICEICYTGHKRSSRKRLKIVFIEYLQVSKGNSIIALMIGHRYP